MMFKVILAIFALLAGSPASAATLHLYVAKSGSDANDCSTAAPCLTLQHAVDVCAIGDLCNVHIGDGDYTESPTVTYWRLVAFFGDCGSLQAVNLNGIISGQDNAIVMVSCMQVVGLLTRQFAIMDYSYTYFAANPGGIHVSATEKSKINCGTNDYIVGDAAYHFAASGQSTVNGACPIYLVGSRSFTAFAYSVEQSLLLAPSSVPDGGSNSGAKCLAMDTSLIKGGSVFPGSGSC